MYVNKINKKNTDLDNDIPPCDIVVSGFTEVRGFSDERKVEAFGPYEGLTVVEVYALEILDPLVG